KLGREGCAFYLLTRRVLHGHALRNCMLLQDRSKYRLLLQSNRDSVGKRLANAKAANKHEEVTICGGHFDPLKPCDANRKQTASNVIQATTTGGCTESAVRIMRSDF